MKKLIPSVFMACLGGFIALSASHFFYNSKNEKNNQISNPDLNANYKLIKNTGNTVSENSSDLTFAAEKSVHSVVHITTISEQINNLSYDPFAELFFGPQKRQQSYELHGSGSGVIISEDGYIVTNNHVIAGSNKIEVILNDRRTYEAEIIGSDASTDLALLKIKETGLPFLNYGNSDGVRIGEWVLAVGNPFNLNSTVTGGIISAKGRNNILNTNNRPIESFIQTDAAVNPGNSGGALVNSMGELIGINTAIASNNGAYQGYSFAVPVNIVKKIVSDLVEFGTVQRAYIGVSIQDIDAKFASDKNFKQLKGIYVNGISSGGSAEDAGINEGDIITKVHDVAVASVSELQEQLSKYRPGDKINLAIVRNEKEMSIPVVLKTFDNSTRLINKRELVKKSVDALGAQFEEVDNTELAGLRIDHGVKITKINNGKLAHVGIQPGFIVTSIDNKKMLNINDVKNSLANKSGIVKIEGCYPNGIRASYSFGL